MDKYKKTAETRLGNTKSYGNHKTHPEELARIAHVKGHFAAKERDEFFDEVYGEVLVDFFLEWLKTEPHETKSREFLYASAMALGSVKQRMINFEMCGKNIPHLMEDTTDARD
jgi:sulfatase maturation enzyme AslB (radical SAM superfamily)